MKALMPIPKVTTLVASCWMNAEKNVRDLLAKQYLDKGEEFITELFHGKFRQAVVEASSTRAVQDAFLHDLESAFPALQHFGDLKRLANGISATTTLHPRETEKKSGGDIGIVFVRPNVTEQMPSILDVDPEYHRGLLCQAKIKRRAAKNSKPKWGDFTDNQKKVLLTRLNYLSLLLYEYKDNARHRLAPFGWQLCHNAKFHEVEQWLKSGRFPDLLTSERIISLLGKAKIGTDDKHIIEQCICPCVRDTLIVKIGWPPGEEPPAQIHVSHQLEQEQKQYIHLYQQ